MPKKKKEKVIFGRDDDNNIYKYPSRKCKDCKKYPCFRGIENLDSDFAKYGCLEFEEW